MELPSGSGLENEPAGRTYHWRRSSLVWVVGHAVAIGSAVAVWLGICAATGDREAWDSPVYFSFGVPALTIVSGALGFLIVHHPWRWALIMALTQLTVMLVSGGPAPLLPIGLGFLLVLAIPGLVAAYLGSFIARRLAR